MTTRDELRQALAHPNVRAFLRLVREGESSQDDSAYSVMYGGGHFSSFADHPRHKVDAHGIVSSAAGAYQFLQKTWDELVALYGFEDFSPACQDEAAVALIVRRRSLEALRAGNLADALDRCSWEWASLPPPRYGQPTLSAERAYATYEQWGGHYLPVETPAPQPATEGTAMPFPALALAALPTLIENIPALIRLFGKGEQSKANAVTAEKVVDIVKTATGATSIEEAISKVTSDPSARQAANAAVEGAFYTLSEAGGGGIEGARQFARALGDSATPFWKQPSFAITVGLLPLLYGTVWIVLTSTSNVFSGELRAAIASSVVTGILGGVLGFWLGTSFGSGRKTELLAKSQGITQ